MRTGAKTLRPRAVFTRTFTSESQLVNTQNKMNTKFNLSDILASEANVILQVSSDDLKMFAQDILIGAKSVAMLEAETAASGDQLLTIDEASKLLAVSKMTLYRWDQSGVLKKLEIGGKRRYRKSDIDRLVGCKM